MGFAENEDEIAYYQGDRLRVLRGKIIEETEEWVIIQRRDGDYKIMMRDVNCIRRATKRRGAYAHGK